MLKRARRLPQRYNRTVTRSTRDFVSKRHVHLRQYKGEKWRRRWQRTKEKMGKMRAFVVRFFVAILGGFVVILIGIVLFSPLLTVRQIRVMRTDPRISQERVQTLIKPLFHRHMLFLSSSEVFPLLHEGLPADATRRAQPGIPDVTGVSIKKQYPSTLILTLTLDPLINRLNIIDPNAGAKAATGTTLLDFLTSQGVYANYSPAQSGSGTKLPVLNIVDWGIRPAPWSPLLDAAFLRTIQQAEQALSQQFGQGVKDRTIYLRASEFHFKTDQYTLWFDLKSPLEEQLLRYRVFLQTVGKAAVKEYIDLRLTDRVVYK